MPRIAFPRWTLAAIVGALLGIGLGLLVAMDRASAAGWALALLAALLLAARLIDRADGRLRDLSVVGFAAHLAALAVLHAALVGQGRFHGFLFADDLAYATFADRLLRTLRGVSGLLDIQDFHLYGAYSYLTVVVFSVFGADAVYMKVLNAGLLMISAVFLFDLTRRFFGRTPALIATTLYVFFPSIFLWSLLNLKDSLALLLLMLVLWGVTRAITSGGSFVHLLVAYAAMVPLQSVRLFLFAMIAVLIPASLAIAWDAPWAARWRYVAAASSASALLVLLSGLGALGSTGLRPLTLQQVAQQPSLSAAEARTAFVDPQAEEALELAPGQSVVVASPIPAPGETNRASRSIEVEQGTLLVVVPVDARPNSRPGVVFVRPGDVVTVKWSTPCPTCGPTRPPLGGPVVAPSGAPPVAAVPFVEPIVIQADAKFRVEVAGSDNLGRVSRAMGRVAENIPIGLVYTMFAPFPWEIDSRSDLLAAGQMVLWYPLLLAAVASGFGLIRQWRRFFFIAAYAAGAILIFAIGEGNVGTLFRHRAMVEPIVLMFASPLLARWALSLRRA